MKKMVILVGMLTLVAFVAVATAQPKPAPATPATTVAPAPAVAPAPEKAKAEKPKAAAKMEKFSGTVDKVDEMAKTIAIKGKKDTMTFTVGDKTKITKGGKDTPLAELKKDMGVSVEYMKEGDKMMAGSIRVAAPKAAPKAKAAEKPAEKPAEAPKK
jgi:hypothetical protein